MAGFILSAFADEADANIDKQIEVLQKNEIGYIEVRQVNGKNITKLDDKQVEELKIKLELGGIKTWSIGSPIGVMSIKESFEKHFAEYKRTIEIAKMLECKNIRLFSFIMPNDEDPSKSRDEVMKRMAALLEYAEGTGIDLCLENEKKMYGDNLERTLDVFRTLGTRLKGVFDPSNYIQCGVETLSAFKDLEQYLKYMHIKDATMSNGNVVPAGYGDGKIKEILSILNKRNEDVVLTIEPHLRVDSGYFSLDSDNNINTTKFVYKTKVEAFDAACDALKKIIKEV